jgi:hypothetical protein
MMTIMTALMATLVAAFMSAFATPLFSISVAVPTGID